MHVLKKAMIVAAPLTLVGAAADADTFVRMVAGPAGGSWYPLGAKIMEVLQRDVPGIRTSNSPGGGVGNARKVDKGGAELGWTFSFTAHDAKAGQDKFKAKHENIRFFATLFPGILQTAVPAKSNIRSYADLKDKNVSPGKVVFSGNVTTERLLPFYGVNYAMIKKNGGTIHRVGYKDSVALMKDGHIDAFVGLTSVPNSSFIALDFSPGMRLLPVEDDIAAKFTKKYPGFWKTTIKAGSYKNIKQDVQTLATATVLITNDKVPNELMYKLTAAFWNNHAEMVKVHKVWNDVKLKDALLAATVPVHPGALKFYNEKGIAK
jgi:TRAP transporter TAXI family solute receptor